MVVTDGVAPGDTAEISGVVASSRGLLAFGGTCCGVEERAIWTSPDGERWTRVPLRGDLDPRGSYLTDAVATPDGWVMAGTDVDGRSTTLWHSIDGAEWTTGTMDPLPGPFRVMAVAASPEAIVAVGSVDDPDGTTDGLVLRSDDQGRSWQRLAANDAALAVDQQVMLYDIVPHANGLMATGEFRALDAADGCGGAARMTASLEVLPPPGPMTAISCAWGMPALWVSDDGRQWERIDPAVAGLPPSGLGPTLATGPGLVALAHADGPALEAELHASADGTSWVRVATDDTLAAAVLGLSVVNDRVYALVEEFDAASSAYRVWIGTVEFAD